MSETKPKEARPPKPEGVALKPGHEWRLYKGEWR